jgi:IS30 family transposase
MDRVLAEHKRKLRKRIYGRTKPGALLKHHIPIRTDNWDITRPGFVELDLVSHSGNSADGEFIYSLNLTDIYSGWTETRALMGKGQRGVVTALEELVKALPFKLCAIDSDNGTEFINRQLIAFCKKHDVQFTRGRPYKKDDNAHIEQKNWTHVRKLLGWERYDSPSALNAMNDFYRYEYKPETGRRKILPGRSKPPAESTTGSPIWTASVPK